MTAVDPSALVDLELRDEGAANASLAVSSNGHPEAEPSAPGEPFTPTTLIAAIAASDWTEADLNRLVVNVLYAHGSTAKEVRREAGQAIRTLQAILRDARALAPPTEGSL